jgi:hypothetical protein
MFQTGVGCFARRCGSLQTGTSFSELVTPGTTPRHRTFEVRATYDAQTGEWGARVGEQNLNEQRGARDAHRADDNDAPRFPTAAACLGDAVARLITMVDQEAQHRP